MVNTVEDTFVNDDSENVVKGEDVENGAENGGQDEGAGGAAVGVEETDEQRKPH